MFLWCSLPCIPQSNRTSDEPLHNKAPHKSPNSHLLYSFQMCAAEIPRISSLTMISEQCSINTQGTQSARLIFLIQTQTTLLWVSKLIYIILLIPVILLYLYTIQLVLVWRKYSRYLHRNIWYSLLPYTCIHDCFFLYPYIFVTHKIFVKDRLLIQWWHQKITVELKQEHIAEEAGEKKTSGHKRTPKKIQWWD